MGCGGPEVLPNLSFRALGSIAACWSRIDGRIPSDTAENSVWRRCYRRFGGGLGFGLGVPVVSVYLVSFTAPVRAVNRELTICAATHIHRNFDFSGDHRGRDCRETSAGVRRRNVLFDARRGGTKVVTKTGLTHWSLPLQREGDLNGAGSLRRTDQANRTPNRIPWRIDR